MDVVTVNGCCDSNPRKKSVLTIDDCKKSVCVILIEKKRTVSGCCCCNPRKKSVLTIDDCEKSVCVILIEKKKLRRICQWMV